MVRFVLSLAVWDKPLKKPLILSPISRFKDNSQEKRRHFVLKGRFKKNTNKLSLKLVDKEPVF